MRFAAACLLAGLPLVTIELLNRALHLRPELSRKLIHAFSALVVAALPFIIKLRQVAWIGALFIIVLGITRLMRVWRALYGVKRRSYGELWFPFGVMAAALLAADRQVFVTAMLVMGLSDTAAAFIGQRFGGRYAPRIFGKSLEGSGAFLLCTLIIITTAMPLPPLKIFLSGIALTIIELLSPYGSDNFSLALSGVILLGI